MKIFRTKIKLFLEGLLNNAIMSMQHARRKTLLTKDIELALELQGVHFGVVINDSSWAGSRKGLKSTQKENAPKQRKSKTITSSLRKIKKLQKNTTLLLPKTAFSRVIKKYPGDFNKEMKFSKLALLLLQSTTETYLIKLSEFANDIALGSKRTGVKVGDFKLASKQSLKSLLCTDTLEIS